MFSATNLSPQDKNDLENIFKTNLESKGIENCEVFHAAQIVNWINSFPNVRSRLFELLNENYNNFSLCDSETWLSYKKNEILGNYFDKEYLGYINTTEIDSLKKFLTTPSDKIIISVIGNGGYGKTRLLIEISKIIKNHISIFVNISNNLGTELLYLDSESDFIFLIDEFQLTSIESFKKIVQIIINRKRKYNKNDKIIITLRPVYHKRLVNEISMFLDYQTYSTEIEINSWTKENVERLFNILNDKYKTNIDFDKISFLTANNPRWLIIIFDLISKYGEIDYNKLTAEKIVLAYKDRIFDEWNNEQKNIIQTPYFFFNILALISPFNTDNKEKIIETFHEFLEITKYKFEDCLDKNLTPKMPLIQFFNNMLVLTQKCTLISVEKCTALCFNLSYTNY